MKTVAIISEYNPFHLGHEYQIKKIREEFGEDTRIIAIMSGNYTQRGDVALFDRSTRAKCAVTSGVNLVLLLPFPFSLSSAELFAKAAVSIADSLGVVDVLSFGSESGNISDLLATSHNINSDVYKNNLKKYIKNNRSCGYPKAREEAYKELFSDPLCNINAPNNILALEYIANLKMISSGISPHTLKRIGAQFSERNIIDNHFQSATAIREKVLNNDYSALDYVPEITRSLLMNDIVSGYAPCQSDKISSAVLSSFRLNSPKAEKNYFDAEGGLYNRLYNASFKADSITSLITLTDTKKYTSAHIRRAMWFSFFGVTSSDVKERPEYTQVLAMDSVGFAILKEVKKIGGIEVVTKPTSVSNLSRTALRQKELSDKADFIFQLTKPTHTDANIALKTSPYIVK